MDKYIFFSQSIVLLREKYLHVFLFFYNFTDDGIIVFY